MSDQSQRVIELMTQRYHADTTELGRRLLQLEYPAQVEWPDIAQKLQEATELKHVVAVWEHLRGYPVTEFNAMLTETPRAR